MRVPISHFGVEEGTGTECRNINLIANVHQGAQRILGNRVLLE
jgi:hypothetical protein